MAGYTGLSSPVSMGSPTPGGSPSGSGTFGGGSLLDWAQFGTGLLGGALSGASNAKLNAAQMAERKREFDKAFGLQAGGTAINAQHSLESAPMRDRVMAKLQSVLSQTPGGFKPHDVFNGGGVAQQGGYDNAKLQAADAAYKPGDGGVDPSVIRKFLASIGYGPSVTPGAVAPPRQPIPQGVTL